MSLFFFIFRKTKDIFDFIFKTRTFLSEIWLTLLFGEMTNCLLTSDWLAAIQWPFKGFLGIQVLKSLKGLMLKEWNNVKSTKNGEPFEGNCSRHFVPVLKYQRRPFPKLKTLAESPIEKIGRDLILPKTEPLNNFSIIFSCVKPVETNISNWSES